jgi:hypothetical protein
MDKICFRTDTLDGPIWAFDQLAGEVRTVRNELASDDNALLDYGISQYRNQYAMTAKVVRQNLNAELLRLEHAFEELAQKGNLFKSVFNAVEEDLAGYAGLIMSVATWLLNGFSPADVTRRVAELYAAAGLKIDEALANFEEIVALKVAQAQQIRDALANSLRIEFDNVKEDLKRITINTGFADMNIWNLIQLNPDIKRKGVMMGFKGEYWNPEVQQQCTLYAAARRTQIGRPLAANGPWGNAESWARSASKSGHEVSRTPNVGDVFCVTGYYGHVGVVEEVRADGTIVISEANYGYNGKYNVRTVPQSTWCAWSFIR